MIDVEAITKGTEVLDVAGTHVGHVEHHEGTGLRLSNRDAPDGHHHYIPHHWIAKVAEHVHLKRAAADVFDSWPGGHPSGNAQPQPLAALDTPKPTRSKWVIAAGVAAGAIGLVLLLL